MTINIYSQEITDETLMISMVINTGITYHAVQLILHSSPMLHHPPDDHPTDDDRSTVTLCLPRSQTRREAFAATLEKMAGLVRAAPEETVTY